MRPPPPPLYNHAPSVHPLPARTEPDPSAPATPVPTGGPRVNRLVPAACAVVLAAALGAAALLRPAPAAAAPATLLDSTTVDRWTLANGLRVVTRTIKGTGVVAITLGYRFGRNDDPADRRGLAQVLGELAFMGPAGELPARTLEDLDGQRPVGWGYPVMRHATLLTEGATVQQFPGVLAEVARRMKGPDVNAATLKHAIAQVKLDLRAQLDGPAEVSAGFVAREAALGRSEAEIRSLVSGRDLDALTPAEVSQWLRKAYVPANAVLSLTGDLGSLDVRRMVESLFGALPAGAPMPEAAEAALRPATFTMTRPGETVGAIGLIAPPLDDSTHAAFYLAASVFGIMSEQMSARSGADDRRRFQYGLFDEPELARVFPDVQPGVGPERLGEAVTALIAPMEQFTLLSRWIVQSRDRTAYLLGGPVPPAMMRQMKSNPRMQVGFSRAQASCELIRGPEFWAGYRERLARVDAVAARPMLERMDDERYQVRVVLGPGAKAAPASKQP